MFGTLNKRYGSFLFNVYLCFLSLSCEIQDVMKNLKFRGYNEVVWLNIKECEENKIGTEISTVPQMKCCK